MIQIKNNSFIPCFHRLLLFSPYLSALLAQKTKLQVDVVKLPDQFATGSLDTDCPPLQSHLDC